MSNNNPFNQVAGTDYDPVTVFKNEVAANQRSAAGRNLTRVAGIKDRWSQQFAANQRSVDMGAPLAYPEYDKAPLKEVVSDFNETTWVAFLDLTPPSMPTKTPQAPNTTGGESSKPLISTDAALRDAAVLSALGRIERKLDQLLAPAYTVTPK